MKQLRRIKLVEFVACTETLEMLSLFWSENVKVKDFFERSRHRWEDNIDMDHKEIGCRG
jgi:hypothetical protein